jgi:uncharacterized Rmd1/YagE family protein
MVKAEAFFSSRHIPLAEMAKDDSFGRLLSQDKSFLLFEFTDQGYSYFKDYGGIAFVNVLKNQQESVLAYMQSEYQIYLTNYTEAIEIIEENGVNEIQFGKVSVDEINLDSIHIICINLTQSAALFYYQYLSDNLLENTRIHTNDLELKGKVSLKNKKLLKYIGSTLNLKNQIAENLYIFESPMLAYENEKLNHIDAFLNEDLEIKYRYNAIKEQLSIIQENLELFKDISLHQHSSNLEWIIILLILFEVIHVLIDQII